MSRGENCDDKSPERGNSAQYSTKDRRKLNNKRVPSFGHLILLV
jgi:hypothetical protein